MKPNLDIHRIVKFDIGAIHFIEAETNRPDFWTRTLTFTDAQGDTFTLPLYANIPEGLMTREERKAVPEAKAVEALRGIACFPPSSNASVEGLKQVARDALAEKDQPADLARIAF